MKRHPILAIASLTLALAGGGAGLQAARQQASSASSSSSSSSQNSTQPKPSSQPKQGSMQDMPGMKDMPGMDMGDHSKTSAPTGSKSGAQNGAHENHDAGANPDQSNAENDQHTQADAMHSMQMGQGHHMHMNGAHMRMTAPRPATAEDWTQADKVAAILRKSIAKYSDYRLALADGYRIFMPNVPQPEYHFTNYENGFLESFTFNPARPTSLLYRKTKKGGWELIGAMYTASRNATLEQLNQRVPLGVAQWHAHTNLCMPARGEKGDWTRFGLTGSIATEKACSDANGRFYPQVFGWMVHVYPFENTRDKIWGQ